MFPAGAFEHNSATFLKKRADSYGAVGKDEFAAGFGEEIDGGRFGEQLPSFFVAGDEIDAVRAGPLRREFRIVQEYRRSVREQGTKPQAVDATVVNQQLLAGVKINRGSVGILAVGDDPFSGLELRLDGVGERFRAEYWVENAQG